MLDIDNFLQQVYDFCASGKNTEAIDLIYNTIALRPLDIIPFSLLNEIEGKVDVKKLNTSAILAFLTVTFKYSLQIPNHIKLYNRAEAYFYLCGEPEERVTALLEGLKDSGNYWKDMKTLGATEWLAGQDPNKDNI